MAWAEQNIVFSRTGHDGLVQERVRGVVAGASITGTRVLVTRTCTPTSLSPTASNSGRDVELVRGYPKTTIPDISLCWPRTRDGSPVNRDLLVASVPG